MDDAPAPTTSSGDEGGEAACWLPLVCDECGAVVSDGHRPDCPVGGGKEDAR
jgi:hypothetical protein